MQPRKLGRALLPAALTITAAALTLTGLLALPTRVVAALPGAHHLLQMSVPLLPRNVAWIYDTGDARLRSGAYFGYTDGRSGELNLYGEGCGLSGPASLQLSGPTGTVRLNARSLEQELTTTNDTTSHPHIRAVMPATGTLTFDTATLRCRDGLETSARIAATLLEAAPLGALLVGPNAAPYTPHLITHPGAHHAAELTIATGNTALEITRIEYAPNAAATGLVLAATGHPAMVPLWRTLGRPEGLAKPLNPAALTPWDSAYQHPSETGYLSERPAAALNLKIPPAAAGMLIITRSSFRATPHSRPIISRPLLIIRQNEKSFVVPTDALAFGFT